MTQPCSNVLVKKNPYKINLFNTVCAFRTATGLRTVTGRSPGLYNKFVNRCFWPTDPVLLLASETFRKWAVGKQTEENQIWLEKNFMQKFQDHFTPVDCRKSHWTTLFSIIMATAPVTLIHFRVSLPRPLGRRK